jgi:hypothetical protein
LFVLLELRAFLINFVSIRFFFAFLGAGAWKLETGNGKRYRRNAEGAEFWEGVMGLSSESGAGLDCGFVELVKRRFMARLGGGPFRRRLRSQYVLGSTAEPDKG